MSRPAFPNLWILWIEEEYEEYDPLLESLHELVGQDHVVVERTEEEGRARLRDHAFDLVLLDLMLPQNQTELQVGLIHLEAGQRLLRLLRQNTGWATPKDCRVVVLTARGNREALAEVEGLVGSSGRLIQKPTQFETIVEAVSSVLKQAQHGKKV